MYVCVCVCESAASPRDPSLPTPVQSRTGLDWAGLGWTGLDWTGLGWAGNPSAVTRVYPSAGGPASAAPCSEHAHACMHAYVPSSEQRPLVAACVMCTVRRRLPLRPPSTLAWSLYPRLVDTVRLHPSGPASRPRLAPIPLRMGLMMAPMMPPMMAR